MNSYCSGCVERLFACKECDPSKRIAKHHHVVVHTGAIYRPIPELKVREKPKMAGVLKVIRMKHRVMRKVRAKQFLED
jgi:hypothetical protein